MSDRSDITSHIDGEDNTALLKMPQGLETSCPTAPTDNSHQDRSATTFTLFPKLPAELRLRIWRLAAPSAQSITINYTSWTPTPRLVRSYALPTLSQTCKESREVVMGGLELVTPACMTQSFYFDARQDIIQLKGPLMHWYSSMKHVLVADATSTVRRIAVDVDEILWIWNDRVEVRKLISADCVIDVAMFLKFLQALGSLDTVYVVHEEWNKEFVDICLVPAIQARYESNENDFRQFLDGFTARLPILDIKTIPEIKHVTAAD